MDLHKAPCSNDPIVSTSGGVHRQHLDYLDKVRRQAIAAISETLVLLVQQACPCWILEHLQVQAATIPPNQSHGLLQITLIIHLVNSEKPRLRLQTKTGLRVLPFRFTRVQSPLLHYGAYRALTMSRHSHQVPRRDGAQPNRVGSNPL